jgi:O-antigen/teichoic acid export membrane protein
MTLAAGMPFSALALVSQSALQGMEKVLYLTWTTFTTRVASIALLVVLLMQGMGVEAAFISRVLFQAASAALFVWMILHDAPPHEDSGRPHIDLPRALPFAVNRLVTEMTTRAPLLLLPIVFTLAEIGIFDAADRIRLTLGIMVAVATTAIMPALSRSFAYEGGERRALVSFSVKYVCLILSGAALLISIFADLIIHLLYGPKFAQSALLLQVLVWTQVLVATDTVLKQAMIANGREYAVAARALVGIACLAALVIGLARAFGLLGAAAGVLASAAITISMDSVFVARQVLPFDVARFLLKPLACALLAGSLLVALDGASLWLRVAAGLGTYGVAAAVLQLLPRAEREFLLAAARHGFNKRSVNAAPAGD